MPGWQNTPIRSALVGTTNAGGRRMTTDVDLTEVRRSLRVRPGSRVAERFDAMAGEVLAEFDELARVASCWSLLPNTFRTFPPGLARYGQLVLVAITAGQLVSERLTHLTRQRQLFHANVLDAMADAAIYERSALVDSEFRQDAHARGLRLTRRYSPGCPHMDMDQLPIIIEALNAGERIGLDCTSANMLVPVKSLAYLHGADAHLSSDQPLDFCDTCRKTSCIRSRRNSGDS
jgi:hypothetical protein